MQFIKELPEGYRTVFNLYVFEEKGYKKERKTTMKITFMGAGSTVFARNVIGDCMCSEVLRDSTFALYDIDGARLKESQTILEAMRETMGGYGKIECYLGVENRKEALRGANFVVNAIQVGGYDPCTIIVLSFFAYLKEK